ncbi:hypothetical protein AOLI_G00012670 [Acnodon oligacanthus]
MHYLGHKVDAQDLHPVQDKMKAIVEAPDLTNVSERKAYLGLLNYYKFLPNLATLLPPLHHLLKKDVRTNKFCPSTFGSGVTPPPLTPVETAMDPLKTLARNPNEKCIAVVESGGNEGMNQFFSIRYSQCGAKFGNVSEVVKGDLAEVFYVGFESELGVKPHSKIGD